MENEDSTKNQNQVPTQQTFKKSCKHPKPPRYEADLILVTA